MPIYQVEAPDGKILKIEGPEGASEQDILSIASQLYQPEDIKPDTGLTGAFSAGKERLKGDIAALAGRVGLMDTDRAEQYKREKDILAERMFTPTEKSFSEAPFLKFRELLGGSLPYAAAPLAVGIGAATLPVSAPVATGVGLAGAGLASLGQFTGSNLSRQMQEDPNLRLADTSLASAAAAAAPQAALDVVSFRMIPGIGKIFGAAGKEITPEIAQKIAEQGIIKTTAAYGAGAVKTAGIEGTTEAGQQFLERLQAGLNLTDQQARDEYFDSFIGGAVLGGTLAVPGTYIERKRTIRQGAEMEQEEKRQAIIDRQKEQQEAALAEQRQLQQTSENLGVKSTLLLPPPEKRLEVMEEVDPLIDPLGRFKSTDLSPKEVAEINKRRVQMGKPRIGRTFSIEDLADVFKPEESVAAEGVLNRLIASRTGYTADQNIPAQTLEIAAQQRGIDTTTQGFRDFLVRTTGTDDVNTMSPPQRLAVAQAIQKVQPGDETRILESGLTNAKYYTPDQYNDTVKGLSKEFKEVGDQEYGRSSVLKQIEKYSGLKQEKDQQRLLNQAVKDGFLERSVKSGANGSMIELFKPATEVQPLPGGMDIRKETFKQGEVPEAFELRAGSRVLSTRGTQEEANRDAVAFEQNRQAEIVRLEKEVQKLQKAVATRNAELTQIQALGQDQSNEFFIKSANYYGQDQVDNKAIADLRQQQQTFADPVQIVPVGAKPVAKDSYTFYEKDEPQVKFDTEEQAEQYGISRLNDETLQQIIESAASQKQTGRVKRYVSFAKKELSERQSTKGDRGITITTKKGEKGGKERLEKLGIYSSEVQKNVEKLRQTLLPALKRFGLEKVALRLVDSIENGTADGYYVKQVMAIAMDSKNPMGTLRHESIHALKELGAFTDQEWKVLTNKAKSEWVQKYIKDTGLFDPYKDRYKQENGNLSGFDEYIYEEAIAEAFRNFKPGNLPAGMIGNIWVRLNKMFEALRNGFQRLGFQTADDIFSRVEEGKQKPTKVLSSEEAKLAKRPLNTKEDIIADAIQRYGQAINKHLYKSYSPIGTADAAGYNALIKIEDNIKSRLEAIGVKTKGESGKPFDSEMSAIWDKEITPKARAFAEKLESDKTKLSIRPDADYELVRKAQPRGRTTDQVSYELRRKSDNKLVREFDNKKEAQQMLDVYTLPQEEVFAKYPELRPAEKPARLSFRSEKKDITPLDVRQARIYERELENLIKKVGDRIAGMKSEETLADVRKAVKKLQDYTAQGLQGKDWYEKSAKAVLNAFNGNDVLAEKFFQVIAITSANTEVAANFTKAANAWTQFVEGRPIKVGTENENKKVDALLNFGEEWEGRKTNTFYTNLMEAMEGRDSGRSTIDLHMTRMIFGKDAPTDAQYELAENMVRLLASKLDLAPRQIQAASWVTQKAKTTFNDYRKKGWKSDLTDAELNQFAFERAVADYSYQMNKRVAGLPVTEALREPSKEIKTRVQNITGEVIPSVQTSMSQAEELPFANKERLTKDIANEGTVQLIANFLGVTSKIRVTVGSGAYADKVNPNLIVQIVNDDATVAEKDANDMANAMSYVFKQDATPLFRADPKLLETDQLGFKLKFDTTTITPAQQKKMLAIFQDKFGEDAGFTRLRGNELVMINYRGEDGKPFLTTDEAFTQGLAEVTEALNEISTIESQEFFGAKSEYNYYDWKEEPSGTSLVAGIQAGRSERPNIQGGLDDLRESFVDSVRTAVKKSGREPRFSFRQGITAPKTKEFKEFFKGSKIVNEDGSPKLYYHGTSRDITEFKPKQANAIFLTEDPSFANDFTWRSEEFMVREFFNKLSDNEKKAIQTKALDESRLFYSPEDIQTFKRIQSEIELMGGSSYGLMPKEIKRYVDDLVVEMLPSRPNIIPAFVKSVNPFDYQNPDHVKQVVNELNKEGNSYGKGFGEVYGSGIARGNWQEVEEDRVQGVIKKLGFDGFYVKEDGKKNLAVYNPNQVKSAFNVAPTESPDIRFSLRAPETKEFKKWFGNSQIVNKDGSPKVLYHGTARDITEFKPKQANAIFLTDDPVFAKNFADSSIDYIVYETFQSLPFETQEKVIKDAVKLAVDNGTLSKADAKFAKQAALTGGNIQKYGIQWHLKKFMRPYLTTGENIIPVFVKANRPFDYENYDVDGLDALLNKDNSLSDGDLESISKGYWQTIESPKVQEKIKSLGFDGFYVKESFIKNLAVYEPNQVKSAFNQKPTESPDIRYSLRAPETPEFKRFFKGSKIVNEDGSPKVMYHGTTKDFDEFIIAQKVNRTGMPDGFYFTSDVDEANNYASQNDGANIMPVYLNVKNPFDLSKKNKITNEMVMQFRDELRKENPNLPFDWIKSKVDLFKEKAERGGFPFPNITFSTEAMKRVFEVGGYDGLLDGDRHVVAFNPNQIKSATGNFGTFDPENPDVRFSLRSQLSDHLNERIAATTSKRKEVGFVERLMDAISPTAITKIRQGLINKYESIELLSRLRGEQFGQDQLLAETSAIAAALQSDRAAGVAASSFRDGIPVFDKGYTYVSDMDGTVKGLIPILEPLMKYNDPYIFQTFQFYAGTRRGRRLDAEGREKTFTKEDIAAGKELEVQFPEFATVFDEYQKYNQGLVKYMMDTGVISPEEAKIWTQNWDYIPFYRQLDGEKTAGPKVFSPIAGVAKPKKLKGSEAPLDDFMETIVRNARAAIEAGMKNEAARRVVRDVVDFDLGEKLVGVHSGNDIVTVKERGQTVYYRVADPLLVESLKGLNLPQLPFMSFLSAPADLLRNFVTKDPGFILANLGRDSMQAWITSGTNMTPLVDTFKQFGKGLLSHSPEAYALAKAGLTGYDFAGDVESTAKKVEQELRKRTGTRTRKEVALLPITAFWDKLGEASTASDMATRAEVYKRTLERTGSEAEAFYQAMEVINFSRKGNSALIRILSATIPFFNARVQGLDVLYRTGFGKAAMENKEKIQKAFIFRSMVLLGTSVMYWAMVSDDEDYKRLSEEERDNYWIIPGLRVGDKPFRFPIPFELGVLFKVLPERALEYSFGSDTGKDLRKSLTRNAMSTLSFNPIPQAVLPLVENVTNYSFFTGEPVVGRGVEGLAPKFQYGAGTSELAKQMGESLNYSPQKIDNFIRGYTGTLGTYAMMMLDSAMTQEGDPPRASKRMEQMPIIKRFFASNTGTVSAYYDMKEEVDTVVTTVNMLQRTGNSEDLKAYLEENKNLYGLKSYVATLDKNMKQLNQATRLINSSKTMSSDEKREALDKINDAKIKLTDRVRTLRKGYE